MMLQFLSDANLARAPRGRQRRVFARRSRRGVSLFGVVLGLMVLVFAAQIIVQEQARAADRARGERLAEVAAVFAERWEHLIHLEAMDPANAWAVYNDMVGLSGEAVLDVPADLRASGLEPISWTGASPVEVTFGLEAQVYVVSLGLSPIATGMIVFKLADDTRVLTRSSFEAALERWRTDNGAGEDVADASQVYKAVVGGTVGANEVAVLSYRFIRLEQEWVLREPWVGFAGNAQMVGPLDMGGHAIASADQLTSASGRTEISDAVASGSVTVAGGVTADVVSGGDLTAGRLEGASGASFVGQLETAEISVSGLASAALAVATDTGSAQGINATFGSSGAGVAMFATSLTLAPGGALQAGTANIQGAAQASSTQTPEAVASQVNSPGALQVTGGLLLGGAGYAQHLGVVGSMQVTTGCLGC